MHLTVAFVVENGGHKSRGARLCLHTHCASCWAFRAVTERLRFNLKMRLKVELKIGYCAALMKIISGAEYELSTTLLSPI